MNYKVFLTSLILVTLFLSLTAVSASDMNESQVLGEANAVDAEAVQDLPSSNLSAENESVNAAGAYLVLDNDADIENVYVGDLVTWIVTVQNFGPDISKNTQVRDELPDGLQYLYHTLTKGSFNPDTGIWDIGDLRIEDGEVTLNITCIAISVGEQINKVWLTSDTTNLNNETFEEEEIDVLGSDNNINEDINRESVIRNAGNPILLLLMSLIMVFSSYVAREF